MALLQVGRHSVYRNEVSHYKWSGRYGRGRPSEFSLSFSVFYTFPGGKQTHTQADFHYSPITASPKIHRSNHVTFGEIQKAEPIGLSRRILIDFADPISCSRRIRRSNRLRVGFSLARTARCRRSGLQGLRMKSKQTKKWWWCSQK